MLVGGIFFPRFGATMASIVVAGRELYRYGYMSDEGPNAKIREVGAIPLNIAEASMIIGIGVIAIRYMFGPFFGRRKFVRRFTWSKVDIKKEEVLDKIER